MYHHYDDSRQIDDDHTRLVFNHPYYQQQQQQHQVLQHFLPLDLSSSTQYRYLTSPQHGLHHSYQQPSNFVRTPNHPALQQHRHQFDIRSSSRLTEDNYYDSENVSASTGIPRPAHSSSGYEFQNVSSGFKSTISGHRMPFNESKMLLQEDGITVPLGSQNVAGFYHDEQILNSENNDFHFKPGSSTTETTHSYGSASSVFRNNADMIRKMKRNLTNLTPESPKFINDGYSRIQQIESPSYPLSSSESSVDLKTKSGSAASVFRNNVEILKKIKKRLPSYNLHPNTTSPENSSHLSKRDEELKTRVRYHDNDSSRTSSFYSDSDQVNKDHDNGIMSVFDTNLSFVTQVQPPSSPVPSLTESSGVSSGVSSGSCDSNFGIKELLMLPSSYRDLSLFQKKYFPTNDYAENKHINVRINHYCDNSTSPKIKTEAKDLDIEVSHSCKESSGCVQNSNVPTSTNILTDTSPTSTVSTIKLEKCNNINFDKNTANVCQVCGDKAAGFYCGAFVCEACKKFFMRAAKHGELKKYTCLKDSNCIITKVNRIQCQYCRYQKCVTLKMFCPGDDNDQKKGRTNSNIACQVCGAQSSGFHFGALTCEGCKGFFRRMAKERNPNGYICSKGKKCLVSLSTRNGCKACRYQKCIAVGMSVSCSRIGRQPNAVKHALSLAVKQQKGTPTSTILSPSSALSPSTVSSTTSPTTVSSTTVSSSTSPASVSSTSPSMWLASLSTISSENYIQDSILNLDSKLLIGKIKEAGEAFRPINTVGSVTRSEIVGTITDYKKMWKELMKMFISHSKCVINFSKKLPGFRLLDIKTQVLLIQISCYTVILLQLSLNYDVNSKDINFFNLSKEEMKAVMEFFPNFEPVRSHLHHIGTMVQALSLDYTETCLISALLIMDEDNAKLYEREMLGQMQEKISECLRTYEEESYDNGAIRYGVLLLRLGEFSLASLQYGQALVGLETLYPDLEYPQLFTEMMIH